MVPDVFEDMFHIIAKNKLGGPKKMLFVSILQNRLMFRRYHGRKYTITVKFCGPRCPWVLALVDLGHLLLRTYLSHSHAGVKKIHLGDKLTRFHNCRIILDRTPFRRRLRLRLT